MSEKLLPQVDIENLPTPPKKAKPLYVASPEDLEKHRPQEPVEEPEIYVSEEEGKMLESEESIYEEKVFVGVDGTEYLEREWLEPIVEGGPTRQEVEEWKSKYKRIYFLPFDSGVYIFRTLKRPEYKEIVRNVDLSAMDREELFAERCILFPRDFTIQKAYEGDAGVISVLSDAIMEKSGFVAKTGIIKL